MSFDFSCLYYAVLGLGACLQGDAERCNQFLQIAWSTMANTIYNSQSLQALQASYLLVR
jgi:hypothetical protein